MTKHRAGIEMTHVPYRGVAAGGMSDLVSGRIDLMFNTTGSLLQAARAGTVRALAVTLPERAATAPEIPTIAEAGVPGFDLSGWYGLLAPAKTRADILRRCTPMRRQYLLIPRSKRSSSRSELTWKLNT